MMPNTAKKGKHVSQGLYPEGCKTTCRSFKVCNQSLLGPPSSKGSWRWLVKRFQYVHKFGFNLAWPFHHVRHRRLQEAASSHPRFCWNIWNCRKVMSWWNYCFFWIPLLPTTCPHHLNFRESRCQDSRLLNTCPVMKNDVVCCYCYRYRNLFSELAGFKVLETNSTTAPKSVSTAKKFLDLQFFFLPCFFLSGVQGILNCEAETMASGTVIMMFKSFGLVDTLGKSLVSSL